MNAVIVPVIGGLGNQMFQVAHALQLEEKTGVIPLFSDLTGLSGRVSREWELDCFNIPQKPLTKIEAIFLKLRIHLSVQLRKLSPKLHLGVLDERYNGQSSASLACPKICSGYWQGLVHFRDAADRVKKVFTFPTLHKLPHGLDFGRDHPVVAVHVRRGDYVNDPVAHAFHFVCDENWYITAMRQMREKVPGANFYIFSDDQVWAQAQFGATDDVSIVATDPRAPAWVDMALMSYCQHFIISNSSYSWWASYLGKTNNSVIFAPKLWFRNRPTLELSLYCDDWKLL